jgi:hypothetical protein
VTALLYFIISLGSIPLEALFLCRALLTIALEEDGMLFTELTIGMPYKTGD